MIIKRAAAIGNRMKGLIRYQMDPNAEGHDDPRVIGSWDGMPERWGDPDELAGAMEAPRRHHGVGAAETVYHFWMRVAEEDRELTDREFVETAMDTMQRIGAIDSNSAAVRWAVIRHADDHAHVAFSMIREDGTKVDNRGDFFAMRDAARAAEDRYGLRATAEAGMGTPGWKPGGVDSGDREAEREQLRQLVRAEATSAGSWNEMVQRLRGIGCQVVIWDDGSGKITGWQVSHPDRPDQKWGGGSLDRSLTAPKLQQRFQGMNDVSSPVDPERLVASPPKTLGEKLTAGELRRLAADAAALAARADGRQVQLAEQIRRAADNTELVSAASQQMALGMMMRAGSRRRSTATDIALAIRLLRLARQIEDERRRNQQRISGLSDQMATLKDQSDAAKEWERRAAATLTEQARSQDRGGETQRPGVSGSQPRQRRPQR